ncbi:hypothetical protein NFI96_004594 [Prochilodus magdalenae]|nr:hypothetical protein NFI96_004594 [Prochilodus magdalenae]
MGSGLSRPRHMLPVLYGKQHHEPSSVVSKSKPLSSALSPSAPPEWSVVNDPAFSRKPRCAKVDRAQHCSCDAGFHMSGTSDSSICQDLPQENRSVPTGKNTRHTMDKTRLSIATNQNSTHSTTAKQHKSPHQALPLEHPHTVPADGAVGVEVEGHQAFWTCDGKPFILVLTTVPPHTDSLGVSTKTKAGLVTEDDPLPF